MSQRESLPKKLTSLGFMVAYLVPALPILSIWLGHTTQRFNAFAIFPLFIFFVVAHVIEFVFPYKTQASISKGSDTTIGKFYYRGLLWLCLPIQLLTLYLAVNYWCSDILNIWGKLAYLMSVGICNGTFSITVAHELIHHQHRLDRLLGGSLLSTVGFGSFKIVHLRVHHRYVCTPHDFATAQRGQSIYDFWWKNIQGNVIEALRCDRADRAIKGRYFWHSELLAWSLLSLVWLGLSLSIGGWQGGIFWSFQALIGILQLDLINYLQHYGLTRKQDIHGRYEPVQAHHAWSFGLFLHDWGLINLFKHGDHHANPQRHYQSLRRHRNVPEYPYNTAILYALSLVPPLFRRAIHPHLDRFEQARR